jgi:hypothetical protein
MNASKNLLTMDVLCFSLHSHAAFVGITQREVMLTDQSAPSSSYM